MFRRRNLSVLAVVVAAALAAFAGCGPKYDVEDVRARADEMSRRIMAAYYDTDAHGEELNVAEIIADYSDLADPSLARFVGSLRDRETDPREKKQLDFLYYDLVGTIVWQGLAALNDTITNIEAGGVVTVGDEEIPYRELGIALYNETDSALRESYYIAMGNFVVENTNPLRSKLVEATREELRRYGFDDLDEYESARRSIDFDVFEENVVAFLEETDEMYLALTQDAAHDVFGVDVTGVPDYDRGRLFRGAEFDRHFPADGAVPLLETVLSNMGINLSELDAIDLDAEDRPEKEPRPASYPVVPGEDVRILVKPTGGVYDYESLFHEMGHALHDAFVSVGEYEFQRLGDYGTTETYAYVLEDVLSDEAFLKAHGFLDDERERRLFLRKQLLSDLGGARYYAGLMRYERLLHGGELTRDELIEAYGTIIGESRLVPLAHPEFGYQSDNEDFYGVNYLEAWFLAAQLRATLSERFGPEWWLSSEAGAFLKELWAHGSEFSPNEVARMLGYEGLDSNYYIEELKRAYELYG
jgi:oligoendopeptidase F